MKYDVTYIEGFEGVGAIESLTGVGGHVNFFLNLEEGEKLAKVGLDKKNLLFRLLFLIIHSLQSSLFSCLWCLIYLFYVMLCYVCFDLSWFSFLF